MTTPVTCRLCGGMPCDHIAHAIQGSRVITMENHRHALAYAEEQAERKHQVEVRRLRDALAATNPARTAAALKATAEARRHAPFTGKHGPDCWQRHAHCLAVRIEEILLDGKDVTQPDTTALRAHEVATLRLLADQLQGMARAGGSPALTGALSSVARHVAGIADQTAAGTYTLHDRADPDRETP